MYALLVIGIHRVDADDVYFYVLITKCIVTLHKYHDWKVGLYGKSHRVTIFRTMTVVPQICNRKNSRFVDNRVCTV